MCLRRAPLFLLAAFAAAVPASGQDAERVFERLTDTYDSIERLSARFTYRVSSEFLGEGQTISGYVVAERNRYRVDTGTELVVVNPEGTFVYRREEEQIVISDYDENTAAFAPGAFLLDFARHFETAGLDTELQGGERHNVLTLRPKRADTPFAELTVWMRRRDGIVTRLAVVDANDTHTDISLRRIELDPRVAPSTFRFTPPSGVEIIDLRS